MAAWRQREREREQLDQARAERDEARVLLEQARSERREAAAVMASEPSDQPVALAHANAQHVGEQARRAAARGAQLAYERKVMGRLARLGERGRALKTQLAAERAREQEALVDQRDWSQEADAREADLGQDLREWEARHPGARAPPDGRA